MFDVYPRKEARATTIFKDEIKDVVSIEIVQWYTLLDGRRQEEHEHITCHLNIECNGIQIDDVFLVDTRKCDSLADVITSAVSDWNALVEWAADAGPLPSWVTRLVE